MTTPVLEASHVGVTYDGDAPVLVDASFSIGAGELVAVVGPNGAGKSTLFKALAGFVDHTGDVIIHGKHCHHLERQSIAYIPQQTDFDVRFPITVEEVVLSGRRRFHGRRMRATQADVAQAMACLAQVSLSGMEDRSLATLSGGQVQRVLLARALAQEADVLLLDEALSGVDEARTAEMITLFQDLTSTGTSILVSTHDLNLVRRRFTRCLAVNRQLVGDGDPNIELAGEKLDRLFAANTIDAHTRDVAR